MLQHAGGPPGSCWNSILQVYSFRKEPTLGMPHRHGARRQNNRLHLAMPVRHGIFDFLRRSRSALTLPRTKLCDCVCVAHAVCVWSFEPRKLYISASICSFCSRSLQVFRDARAKALLSCVRLGPHNGRSLGPQLPHAHRIQQVMDFKVCT